MTPYHFYDAFVCTFLFFLSMFTLLFGGDVGEIAKGGVMKNAFSLSLLFLYPSHFNGPLHWGLEFVYCSAQGLVFCLADGELEMVSCLIWMVVDVGKAVNVFIREGRSPPLDIVNAGFFFVLRLSLAPAVFLTSVIEGFSLTFSILSFILVIVGVLWTARYARLLPPPFYKGWVGNPTMDNFMRCLWMEEAFLILNTAAWGSPLVRVAPLTFSLIMCNSIAFHGSKAVLGSNNKEVRMARVWDIVTNFIVCIHANITTNWQPQCLGASLVSLFLYALSINFFNSHWMSHAFLQYVCLKALISSRI